MKAAKRIDGEEEELEHSISSSEGISHKQLLQMLTNEITLTQAANNPPIWSGISCNKQLECERRPSPIQRDLYVNICAYTNPL